MRKMKKIEILDMMEQKLTEFQEQYKSIGHQILQIQDGLLNDNEFILMEQKLSIEEKILRITNKLNELKEV